MTAESYWYACYVDGIAPTIHMIPWTVRVHPDTPRKLALAHGAGDGYAYIYDDERGYGRAGYRPVGPVDPRLWDHQIWYWHGAPMPGIWHYIPRTIVRRAMHLRSLAGDHVRRRDGVAAITIHDMLEVLADPELMRQLALRP